MRCEAIDEWRKWNAKKRAPFRYMVSLDAPGWTGGPEGTAPCLGDRVSDGGGGFVSPDRRESRSERYAGCPDRPPGLSAKLDADYLVWYLERHGLWLSLLITLCVMAGYSQREAARILGVSRESYRDNLLPRWQGLCQLILGP